MPVTLAALVVPPHIVVKTASNTKPPMASTMPALELAPPLGGIVTALAAPLAGFRRLELFAIAPHPTTRARQPSRARGTASARMHV